MDPETKANILMVDDRPEQLLALETILEDLDQNLVKAHSGKEALRYLLHHDFAVVLLDVKMPDMDGFETAALIRQRKNTEHTPIIFLTSYGQEETHVSRGYSLGAVDYMSAPVVPEILRAKIAVFVELFKQRQQIKRREEHIRLLERNEHERRLAEARERLEIETKRNLFFVLSIDLLAVAGFDGVFKQLNPAWEKTLGYRESELLGRQLLDFVHAEDKESTRAQWEKLAGGQAISYFDNRVYHKDHGYKWIAWTAAPSPHDALIYLSARDVTERRLTEDRIRVLKDELEQRVVDLTDINQELESFTYSIAHDLRAPLRAMQGFSKALLDDYGAVLDATGKDFAQRIVGASEQMDRLIQDLLNYSRLGRAQLPVETVELEMITTEAIDYLDTEISEKQANIEVVTPMPRVFAHRATLLQVISNLLSNAVKFVGQSETPRIRISANTQELVIRLAVEDNGIGIAPEHHSRIFRVFERLHTKETYPGTGIGLAIVRRGVERMGGRVGLESQPGNGSRFWIELPAARDSSSPSSSSSS